MKVPLFALVAAAATSPLLAQETREMDAHVHGVSTLELAVENGVVEMNLVSPGADIVGFEYEASTDADKDAVEAGIRMMLLPENVVALPAAAECRLTEALAHLHGSGAGHYHEEERAEQEDHEHEDHPEGEDHAEGDEHAENAEGAAHAEGVEHNEFHARYIFACEHPEELTRLGFPFFERFENAQEIEAQYVTDAGAGASEIRRDAAELILN